MSILSLRIWKRDFHTELPGKLLGTHSFSEVFFCDLILFLSRLIYSDFSRTERWKSPCVHESTLSIVISVKVNFLALYWPDFFILEYQHFLSPYCIFLWGQRGGQNQYECRAIDLLQVTSYHALRCHSAAADGFPRLSGSLSTWAAHFLGFRVYLLTACFPHGRIRSCSRDSCLEPESLKKRHAIALKKKSSGDRIEFSSQEEQKIPQNAQSLHLYFRRSLTLDRFKSSPASDVPVSPGTPGKPVTCLFSFTLESPWVENFLDGCSVSRQRQCIWELVKRSLMLAAREWERRAPFLT